MKKIVLLLLMVFVLSLAGTASARSNHHRHHDWSDHTYQSERWHRSDHVSVTLTWYRHRDHYAPARYRMERIHDREWADRFPGLYAYRWHDRDGEGFRYHGRRVTNAVFFYNHDDELVSVGFMNNGAFIFIRDDNNGFSNDDSFFVSWWQRG